MPDLVRSRAARLIAVAAAAAAAALASSGPGIAARCPTETFLSFGHLAYVAQPLPASAGIPTGPRIGVGTVDEPTESSGCKRRRVSLPVRQADGIDARVAVIAQGRPGTIFVLGARCAGYEETERWSCLRFPLALGGRRYTGVRYPGSPPPRGSVPVGSPLGEADLAGRTVAVRRIEGVKPALAVAVRARPNEAFVAPGVCPYERFENTPARDDLLRCLRSPVWFTFDPPGGEVGDRVVARSDRPLGGELARATLSLVRLPVVADIVPPNPSAGVRIGRPTAKLPVTVPDVAPGLYEAVVSCPSCSASHGEKTLFPAGSLLVSETTKGSAGPRIVSLVLGVAVLGLAVASVVVFRRSRRRRPTEPGSAGS
jgi:hypothetical protein